MSAKQAKKIRKLTKQIVHQKVAEGTKISDETLYVEVQKNRKYGMVSSGVGAGDKFMQIASGTVLTTPTSVRGVYRAIKKQLAK